MIAGHPAEHSERDRVGAGSLCCRTCGFRLGSDGLDRFHHCPECGGTSFRRTRLFEPPPNAEGRTTLERPALPAAPQAPAWLADARRDLPDPGHYLAFQRGGQVDIAPLPIGWSLIGRSAAARIRLDDPTVSRRHALVVRTGDGEVRVLDDRSLNGVRVNGERVEWGSLADGDELAIGRFRLYLVEREPTGADSADSEPSLA
jgi:hypothetical protein